MVLTSPSSPCPLLLRQQKRHSAPSSPPLSPSFSLSLFPRPSAAINLFFFLFFLLSSSLTPSSLSLSPFLFLSFLFFFYAAHQSFLLAFLFSLLASRPFSRRARMHARTHACTTRLCNRVYSSMTPHASSHRVLAQRFPLKHRSERNATRLVSNRISFTIFNLLSKEG